MINLDLEQKRLAMDLAVIAHIKAIEKLSALYDAEVLKLDKVLQKCQDAKIKQ